MTHFLQEGAFALVCKSSYYPGEVVATRRGSPLLIGIRSDHHVVTNNLPVIMNSPNGGKLGERERGGREGKGVRSV